MNTRLGKYTVKRGMTVRSHSFKLHFITSLLEDNSLQALSQLIEHASVSTTDRYNKKKLKKRDPLDLLKHYQYKKPIINYVLCSSFI